jgi:NAD(P)H-hydrate epimerase
MKIISVETMRRLDRRTIENGTPGAVLMERAGVGAFESMTEVLSTRFAPHHRRRFVVVVGKGNNGGDGYVVARCLAGQTDLPVTVFSVCPVSELSGDARVYAERVAERVPVRLCERLPASALRPGTVIVDALLGTGVTGSLRPPYDILVRQINESGCPVVSLDVPSGLNADTGAPCGEAVRADLTVTMASPKTGLLSESGRPCCGLLRCVDIGIPARFTDEAPATGEAIFEQDLRVWLSRRSATAHKHSLGHVLVVGGSGAFCGAPVLTAGAALRSGAGLCTLVVPEPTRDLVRLPYAALMLRAAPATPAGLLGERAAATVAQLADGTQAVVCGPGLGDSDETVPVLEAALSSTCPAVVDADGLRVLGRHPGLVTGRSVTTVLTPHPGEARALAQGMGITGFDEMERVTQARALARVAGCLVVLKGHASVVADASGRVAVNSSGTSGLATAGSGDVLAGLLAGLLAQEQDPWQACCTGVFLHGLCSELSLDGDRALVADDLLELLGKAWRAVTPFA